MERALQCFFQWLAIKHSCAEFSVKVVELDQIPYERQQRDLELEHCESSLKLASVCLYENSAASIWRVSSELT